MRFGTTIALGLAVQVCVSSGAARGATPLTTTEIASGLNRPVFVTHAPGDFGRIFIIEQTGRIRIFDLTSDTLLAAAFLSIPSLITTLGSEQGLLGMAFHPDYANNGFFYVNYTQPDDATIIARYQVSADPNMADASSALILMTISQPQRNHNGGWMAFGPDGYLYIGMGDGGNADDTGPGHTSGTGNAQDITNNLLGKMLRIDVDATDAGNYGIPPTNPFVGITGDDEIWSYGLRNPWRNAFDPETGELYMADVGQNLWEEINVQPADSSGGENWGWRCREGAHDFNFGGDCGSETLLDPIYEYSHGGSPFRCSITGGEVMRSCSLPDLSGTYFFADFCSRQIWSFRYVDGTVTEFVDRTAELDPTNGDGVIEDPSSFGRDAYGDIYICDLTGEVYKIIPADGATDDCNANGVEDACDILDGSSADSDENGLPDECILTPPGVPNPPHEIEKNRYITFAPNNGATVIAFEVALPDGRQGWVGQPQALNWQGTDPAAISAVVANPVFRIWSEPEIHVTGCVIVPNQTYPIRTTEDGNVFTSAYAVNTVPTPTSGSWADTVGSFDGAEWSSPNGATSFADINAAIKKFQQVLPLSSAHVTRIDLEPQTPNYFINFGDIDMVVKGFQAIPYPPVAWTHPTVADCPLPPGP